MIASAEKNVAYQNTQTARKPWDTDAMISEMEEKRKWKNVRTKEGNNMYAKLNNALSRETDAVREERWKREFNELEEVGRGGRSDLIYRKMNTLTGLNKVRNKNGGIKDEQGELMFMP